MSPNGSHTTCVGAGVAGAGAGVEVGGSSRDEVYWSSSTSISITTDGNIYNADTGSVRMTDMFSFIWKCCYINN